MAVATLLLMSIATVRACPDPSPSARVVQITGTQDIGLTTPDGGEIALAHLVLPEKGQAAWHFAGTWLADGPAALSPIETDRYSRTKAHIHKPATGAWLQHQLLAQGHAYADPPADDESCRTALLAAEREARMAKRGVWASPLSGMQTVDSLKGKEGRFVVVEGQIVSARPRSGTLFLNFGQNWRTDFTIRVTGAAKRALPDPSALEGQMIRVRGWLERWDGPMIAIDTPSRIEILSRD